MINGKLTYILARLKSYTALASNGNDYRSLMSGETMQSLRQLYKGRHEYDARMEGAVQSGHTFFGKSLYHVIQQMGKPLYVSHQSVGGVAHHVLLYSRVLEGIATRIVYNLINNHVAAVSFHYCTENAGQAEAVKSVLGVRYQIEKGLLQKEKFCVLDAHGNMLIYNYLFDTVVTYVNMDKSIEQNLNAAVFNKQFSNERSLSSKDFQLTT